jgi:hypothetical protein
LRELLSLKTKWEVIIHGIGKEEAV